MIETAFYQIIRGDSGIIALVGTDVYLGLNPNPDDLYITIHLTRQRRPANIDNTASKQSADFQVDVYGLSSPDVSDLSEAIVTATHYQPAMQDGHDIQFMRVDNEWSDYEEATKLFRKSLDISVFFD